jgi:aconitase B
MNNSNENDFQRIITYFESKFQNFENKFQQVIDKVNNLEIQIESLRQDLNETKNQMITIKQDVDQLKANRISPATVSMHSYNDPMLTSPNQSDNIGLLTLNSGTSNISTSKQIVFINLFFFQISQTIFLNIFLNMTYLILKIIFTSFILFKYFFFYF